MFGAIWNDIAHNARQVPKNSPALHQATTVGGLYVRRFNHFEWIVTATDWKLGGQAKLVVVVDVDVVALTRRHARMLYFIIVGILNVRAVRFQRDELRARAATTGRQLADADDGTVEMGQTPAERKARSVRDDIMFFSPTAMLVVILLFWFKCIRPPPNIDNLHDLQPLVVYKIVEQTSCLSATLANNRIFFSYYWLLALTRHLYGHLVLSCRMNNTNVRTRNII